MTEHEILSLVAACQDEHEKLDHPLTIECFVEGLRLNERKLGFSPSVLSNQFFARIPRLEGKSWIEIHPDKCGLRILTLTARGREQLKAWDDNGCETHQSGRGHHKTKKRKCVASDPRWAA